MNTKYNKNLVQFAKKLRRNMTKEERHLWYDFLREHPLKFTRQKVFGKYIADFYCAKARIIIELDGSQHYEEIAVENDEIRTLYLKQYNVRVIRISNLDVLRDFDGVCQYIDNEIKNTSENLYK